MCSRFWNYLLVLYIGRVHGAISGCTVLGEVHPASAHDKSLISDTKYFVWTCQQNCTIDLSIQPNVPYISTCHQI